MTDGNYRAVAQLVERSLPAPEIRSSKPLIGKFDFVSPVLICTEKRGREWPIKKLKKLIHLAQLKSNYI